MGEKLCQRWAHLVISIGQQQQKTQFVKSPRQKQQRFQTRIIAPVNILNDDEQRLRGAEIYEDLDQGLMQTTLFLVALTCRKR
jgi:hypothetical protein